MSHTPGPWNIVDFAPPIVIEANREDEVWCIAEVGNGEMPSTEEEANARLMSASPDAHAILLAINEFFRHHNPAYPSTMFDEERTLKQAVADYLAKAEGHE